MLRYERQMSDTFHQVKRFIPATAMLATEVACMRVYCTSKRLAEHQPGLHRSLVSQLIRHERIETTLPRAKELRRVADQMVTLGKEV